MSDNNITSLKELSDIFTNATIANPTLPSSSRPDTPKLPMVKIRETGEATREEEVQEKIRPAIKIERWHIRPSIHIYPTRYKTLAIQSIIMNEPTKKRKPNHGRV